MDQESLVGINEAFRSLPSFKSSQDFGRTACVQALVDPLLYCLVYGETLLAGSNNQDRPRTTSIPTTPIPTTSDYALSQKFALLPSDFSFTMTGAVKFLSYINNLHPRYQSVYRSLEAALSAFMPLFEHVLTDLHRNNPLCPRIQEPYHYTVWEEPEPPEYSDDEDGWTTYQQEMRQWIMNRPLCLPDVPDDGYSGGLESRRHVVSLRDGVFQVIVDLYEIRLVRVHLSTLTVISCLPSPCSNLEVQNMQVHLGM